MAPAYGGSGHRGRNRFAYGYAHPQEPASADGRTGRIGSKAAASFDKVEFIARSEQISCCSLAPDGQDADAGSAGIKTLELDNVLTTQQDVGSSLREITVKAVARPMTQGEIDMAWMVFHDAVDYRKVRIHNERYLWFGLQPKNVAMTPNGEMYFHESAYMSDFSSAESDIRRWFLHEMVHIWQFQLGYSVKWRGAVRIGLGYDYTLEPGRRLAEYNMEAQGEILADYFAIKFMGDENVVRGRKYHIRDIYRYNEVLRDFFANRKNIENLPGGHIRRDPSEPGN